MSQRERLWCVVFVFCVGVCGPSNWACAQDNRADLPDSPSHVSRSSRHGSDSPSDREVSWRSLPKDFLQDQKSIWLFPTQLAKGNHWFPTLAIVGGTAGLIAADPHAMPYFRSHARNLDDLNDFFGAPITTAEVVVLPVSLMVAGYARHDSYQVGTALLAGEAYADSAVVDLAIKAITRRKRPIDVPPEVLSTIRSLAAASLPLRAVPFHPGTPPVCLLSPQSSPAGIITTAGCLGHCMVSQPLSAFLA